MDKCSALFGQSDCTFFCPTFPSEYQNPMFTNNSKMSMQCAVETFEKVKVVEEAILSQAAKRLL